MLPTGGLRPVVRISTVHESVFIRLLIWKVCDFYFCNLPGITFSSEPGRNPSYVDIKTKVTWWGQNWAKLDLSFSMMSQHLLDARHAALEPTVCPPANGNNLADKHTDTLCQVIQLIHMTGRSGVKPVCGGWRCWRSGLLSNTFPVASSPKETPIKSHQGQECRSMLAGSSFSWE